MTSKQVYILASILALLFFLTEYAWIPWAELPIYYDVPFVYKDGPVRLDSWIYNVSVKVSHVIFVIALWLLTPFKKSGVFMIVAFTLALIEFFFTWNEPIAKLWLPEFWNWHPYIPVSTAPLKLASVCYFMYECVKKAME
jgi:hypothetical protein